MSSGGDVIPIRDPAPYWREAEQNALVALNYARRMLGKAAVVLTDGPDDRDCA
jgi:hypothetical protein